MSGRAGRRGKDDFGVVIQMIDDTMDTRACRYCRRLSISSHSCFFRMAILQTTQRQVSALPTCYVVSVGFARQFTPARTPLRVIMQG